MLGKLFFSRFAAPQLFAVEPNHDIVLSSLSVDPGFDFGPSDFNDGAAFGNFSGNSNSRYPCICQNARTNSIILHFSMCLRADPGFQFNDNDFKQPNGSPY